MFDFKVISWEEFDEAHFAIASKYRNLKYYANLAALY